MKFIWTIILTLDYLAGFLDIFSLIISHDFNFIDLFRFKCDDCFKVILDHLHCRSLTFPKFHLQLNFALSLDSLIFLVTTLCLSCSKNEKWANNHFFDSTKNTKVANFFLNIHQRLYLINLWWLMNFSLPILYYLYHNAIWNGHLDDKPESYFIHFQIVEK